MEQQKPQPNDYTDPKTVHSLFESLRPERTEESSSYGTTATMIRHIINANAGIQLAQKKTTDQTVKLKELDLSGKIQENAQEAIKRE